MYHLQAAQDETQAGSLRGSSLEQDSSSHHEQRNLAGSENCCWTDAELNAFAFPPQGAFHWCSGNVDNFRFGFIDPIKGPVEFATITADMGGEYWLYCRLQEGAIMTAERDMFKSKKKKVDEFQEQCLGLLTDKLASFTDSSGNPIYNCP